MNPTTKKEYIAELIRLTKLQTKALEEDNIEKFTSLLQLREDIIHVIGKIPQDLLLVAEEEVQQERELLKELIDIDNANKEKLAKEMDIVKGELRKIRHNKRTQEHYNNPYDTSQEEGVFFDKRERR